MADRERSIPNGEDTIFALASASKPFTGLAIVQLAQQGRLRFHDTLGMHVDGFREDIAGSVTIHHLLTHTSGLDMGAAGSAEYGERFHTWTSAEQAMNGTLDILRKQPLAFPPGSRNQYSNGGYITLGAIVAAASGQSFYDYMREHVFAPAGMTRTGYYTRPQWLTDERIAHPYWLDSAGQRQDGLHSPPLFGGTPNAGRSFIGSGGGNAFSTAGDLVRFAGALHDGVLLKPAYLDLYLNAKFPSRSSFQAYGAPTMLYGDTWLFGHAGGAAGESTNWTIYRGTDWVGVILMNYGPIGPNEGSVIPALIERERQALLG